MDHSLWGALATSFAICAASGPVLIPLLHKLKFGQSIRDCGPQAGTSEKERYADNGRVDDADCSSGCSAGMV